MTKSKKTLSSSLTLMTCALSLSLGCDLDQDEFPIDEVFRGGSFEWRPVRNGPGSGIDGVTIDMSGDGTSGLQFQSFEGAITSLNVDPETGNLVATDDGITKSGSELNGLTFSVTGAVNGSPVQKVKIVEAHECPGPDGEECFYESYKIEVKMKIEDHPDYNSWFDPCKTIGSSAETHGSAVAIANVGEMSKHGVVRKDDTIHFACVNSAPGKAKVWGSEPNAGGDSDAAKKAAEDEFRATIHMLTADYCDTGPTTVSGRKIRKLTKAKAEQEYGGDFKDHMEAGWGPSGAACVNHNRFIKSDSGINICNMPRCTEYDGEPLFWSEIKVDDGKEECGMLPAGGKLYPGQSKQSCSEKFELVYQNDGNLVLNDISDPDKPSPVWASDTDGTDAGHLTMQNDGNLVIYGPGEENPSPLWASHTAMPGETPNPSLMVLDEGRVCIYDFNSLTTVWCGSRRSLFQAEDSAHADNFTPSETPKTLYKTGRVYSDGVDGVDGVEAERGTDTGDHLLYGPYANNWGDLNIQANFMMRADKVEYDYGTVVTIEIYDATSREVLDEMDLYHSHFTEHWKYQDFTLNATLAGRWGHKIEARVEWYGYGHIQLDYAQISSVPPFCGDLKVSESEFCDDGGHAGGCKDDCSGFDNVQIRASWADNICLDVSGHNSTLGGTEVQLWDCNDVTETWSFSMLDGKIRANWDESICLDVVGQDATADGTNVEISPCDGVTETWTYDASEGKIRAGWDSTVCLDVHGHDETANGTNVQIWDCNQVSETWNLGPIPIDLGPEVTIDLGPEVTIAPSGTYARAAELSGGAILVAHEAYDDLQDELELHVRRSDDGGLTWSEPVVATEVPNAPGRSLANEMLLELPNQQGILMAFRNHEVIGADHIYRLTVVESLDGGTSWSYKSEIFNTNENAVFDPLLLWTNDELQVYYTRDVGGPGSGQDIVMKRSFDGGATWSERTTVASDASSRNGMPGVAVLSDGTLVAVFEAFRNNDTGPLVIRAVRSSDNGTTWTDPEDVYVPVDITANAGAPSLTTLADGRLVLSFMTDEDSLVHQWPDHASAKLMVSDGVPSFNNLAWRRGQVTTVVDSNTYWPGVQALSDGDFLVTYDQGGPKARRGHVD